MTFVMCLDRKCNIDNCEKSNDECLDNPDEKFQKYERHGRHICENCSHRSEQNFAGKNVSKESKRQRCDLGHFSQKLQQPDKYIDWHQYELHWVFENVTKLP